MKYLEYPLFSGGYINRFLMTGVYAQDSPYWKTTLTGKVNEWLIKGSAVYDNPCRKEIVKKRLGNPPALKNIVGMLAGEEVEEFGRKTELKLFFPFGNAGVDASAFYETPARLRSWAYTLVEAREAEETELEFTVCGALTVWVNDELVLDFAPYLRNADSHTRAAAALRPGMNTVVVCMEDLAERDTDFHFKIRYPGRQQLKICIPVSGEVEPEQVYQAEAALDEIYFEKEGYLSEPVYMKLGSFSENPVELTLTSDKFKEPKRYTVSRGQKEILLFHADEVNSGFYYFQVEISACGLSVSRVIGTYSFNTRYLGHCEETYEERKQAICDIVADSNPDSDYSALIRLHRGEMPDNLEEIFQNHFNWIRPKRDCSDFRMTILVYLYARFADVLPEEFRREIEDVMAGYRYWIDEPGDDVMWFFSENHALMFHISQYIAGKSMPERIFTASGLTGREAAKKAEGLLNVWFDSFLTEFATEWNSSTYLPIDVMGLAYLYDLTAENEKTVWNSRTEMDISLHAKAKKALDMLAYSMALYEHRGNLMASFGRTYEKELKGSYSTGMPSLLYLFYNAGHMNDHFRALVPLVLGDYKPPEEYGQYVNLKGNQELIFQNTQGIEKFVNLYLYKNAKTLLSTAVGFRPFGPGYQENVVQATLDGTAQVFINHPGEAEIYGKGRPSFWAGNGCLPLAVQYRNMSILVFHIGEAPLLDYTHAYVPLAEFDSYAVSDGILLDERAASEEAGVAGTNPGGTEKTSERIVPAAAFEKDGGFVGIWALNGLCLQKKGPCRNREFISPGRDNVWVVKVGAPGEYSDVRELLSDMEKLEIMVGDGFYRAGTERKERSAYEVSETEEIMFHEKEVTIVSGENNYSIYKNELYVNGEKAHNYPLDVRGKVELTDNRR